MEIKTPRKDTNLNLAKDTNLNSAIVEFQENPFNPEKVTAFWRTFWEESGKKVNMAFSVPECPLTGEQLTDIEKKSKGLIYVPQEVSTQENRHSLGEMFPQLGGWVLKEGNKVTNMTDNFGWRIVDTSIEAPHLDTRKEGLRQIFVRNNEVGMTLNEYIVTNMANESQGKGYLDQEGTHSRIFGSRCDKNVIHAAFFPNGELSVPRPVDSSYRSSDLGGRGSSGVN